MAVLSRVITRWSGSGIPGGGVSIMYVAGTAPVTDNIRLFWDSIKQAIPANIALTVDSSGDTIEDSSGILTGGWTDVQTPTVVGTGDAQHAGGVGAIIHWRTAAVVGRRRARGATYIVPMAQGSYDQDGTPSGGILGILRTGASDFVDNYGAEMRVWSRKFTPPAGSTEPARLGSSHPFLSATVPDFAATQRGRRG